MKRCILLILILVTLLTACNRNEITLEPGDHLYVGTIPFDEAETTTIYVAVSPDYSEVKEFLILFHHLKFDKSLANKRFVIQYILHRVRRVGSYLIEDGSVKIEFGPSTLELNLLADAPQGVIQYVYKYKDESNNIHEIPFPKKEFTLVEQTNG